MTLFVTIELGRHVFHTVTNVWLQKYGHITSSKVDSVNVVKCDRNDVHFRKSTQTFQTWASSNESF